MAAWSGTALAAVGFVVCGVLFAVVQAVFEHGGGPLRMAAAMTALAYLLAGVNLAHGMSWIGYLGLFATGTVWQAGVIAITGFAAGPATRPYVRQVFTSLRTATPFAVVLGLLGLIATSLVIVIDVSHAVWLTSSALRVAKPDIAVMRRRTKNRIAGTLAGGALAALILTPRLPDWSILALIGAAVLVMQFVTAARYGWWTMLLTIVALCFSMTHGNEDWKLAVTRAALTLAGVFLALLICEIAARGRKARSIAIPREGA
jgi:hypothetical protein